MPEVAQEKLTGLTNQVDQLIDSVTELNTSYQNKKAEIDQATQANTASVIAEKSRIDQFINEGESNYPYINRCRNPYLKGAIENGDVTFGVWNPGGHKFTYELVQPEENEHSRKIAQALGGWGLDGNRENISVANRRGSTYLRECAPQFLRVTMTRTYEELPDTANPTYKLFREHGRLMMTHGPIGHYPFSTGVTSAMLGFIVVENGEMGFWCSDKGTVQMKAGDMGTNFVTTRTRLTNNALTHTHAHHWDYFNVYLRDSDGQPVDEVTFLVACPVVVAGKCHDWRLAATPTGSIFDYAVNRSALARRFAQV